MKLKFPRKLCSRTDITALTLIFRLGSSLLSHCLNVPEASFLSFKDLDFHKEFYRFKAQSTVTWPTCDMFHLSLAVETENLLRQNEFDIEERMKEKSTAAALPESCGWEFSRGGDACAANRNSTEKKNQASVCLVRSRPVLVGSEAYGEYLAQR